MTNRHPLYLILSLIMAVAGVSCNTDSYYYSESETTSAAVKSFSLQKDDSVLSNLDSVFFSIDLVTGRIFNADSLPKGTDISKLRVSISTPSISKCDLTYRILGTDRDTTVSYLASPNDSVNFAAGDVKLTIVSSDGLTSRDYMIRVNVHESVPDTLYWDKMAMRRLPSGLSAPTKQKTVMFKDKALCLTADAAGSAWISQSSRLLADEWTGKAVTLPAGADVNTLTASDDALYILGSDGMLYKSSSADNPSWQSTGAKMTHIYGAYGTRLLGNLKDASGNYNFVTYPATDVQPVPAACPVSGTSAMLDYDSKWSLSPIVMFLGGRLASGKCSESMWGYDGTEWACLTTRGVPAGEGIAVCRYPTFRLNKNSWTVERRDAILAIGGRAEDNLVDNLVYVSYDEGITWSAAADYLKLPEYIADRSDAQLLVESVDYTIDAEGNAVWKKYPSLNLPPWAKPVTPAMLSRVSQPVTEWQCPYIYMFGGVDNDGVLYDQLWRGVINRLTFKPLY